MLHPATGASKQLEETEVAATGASKKFEETEVGATGASKKFEEIEVGATGASKKLEETEVGATGASKKLEETEVGATGASTKLEDYHPFERRGPSTTLLGASFRTASHSFTFLKFYKAKRDSLKIVILYYVSYSFGLRLDLTF